ncbi:T9SS type A sorting domain-containing protein [Adhaeribacter radiodurans]|uniref:T9SS type A sorting domain-containing protein n=1 Tax=Adhaeribacter radiodurans TaxID=2745197 RepID=A0A7L7LDW1_9BACT|nr:T9SS type A sorting domain-containing protein [Adhaeribacter radiodurans]QMU31026.1 T9SS type A sorting domain-containing protein [Adhaeribacter radiodurans]
MFLIYYPSITSGQIKEWDKTLGGSDLDELTSLQRTIDGGYILGGNSYSEISGDKTEAPRGVGDYWIIKVDATGKKQWDKTFGGISSDFLTSLQQTSDGGYILGGNSLSDISGDKTEASKGSNDYWIIKVDATGKKQWDKTFGGISSDFLTSLQQTSDGGYILGGNSLSDISGDKTEASKGSNDYWIIKVDATGKKQWDKTFGGSDWEELSSLQQTTDNGFILGGHSSSPISGSKTEESKGYLDFWLVKLNATGEKQWDKTLGGNSSDLLNSLQQTRDGGYILGGASVSSISGDKSEVSRGLMDFWIIKVDAAGKKQWDKTLGGNNYDELTSLQQTINEGYILGGYSVSNKGGDKTEDNKGDCFFFECPGDYWTVKLDATGHKEWDKTLGGPANDAMSSIQQTSDGSYILGGTSSSGISGDKSEDSRGFSDYWLVKIREEQSTTTQWDMRFGGSGSDNFTTAIKTSDGGYLFGGYSNSDISGDKTQSRQGKNDFWIVKSDKNGKKLWDKRFGGSADDYLNRVIQTKDGGYLLAGSSLSGKDGDKTEKSRGLRDYWLVKVDGNGNLQWDKAFGGSGSDELEKVVQLSTGEYVLGGYSNSPADGEKSQGSQGGNDYWLIKISSTGAKIWDKRYGGSSEEILGSFTQTPEGGFLLAGNSLSGISGDKSQTSRGGSDYWIVRIDKDGNKVWDKTFGGSGEEKAYSVGRSGDSYFMAGTSASGANGDKSQYSQGGQDYWLLKLDHNGNKVWDKRFGGSKDEKLQASTYTDKGLYVLAGSSYSGISGDKTQASHGGSDYWIVKVDENGQVVGDQRFGGNDKDELRTVFQSNDGGFLLGGRSYSGVSGDRTQASQGSSDYWLVKVAPETTSVIAARETIIFKEPVPKTELTLLKAYPNPFKDKLTIHFNLPESQYVKVKLYDIQGRELKTLFQGQVQANQSYHYQLEWHTGNQATGLYLIQLHTFGKSYTTKLLLSR